MSTDKAGMIEYWTGIKKDCSFPKNLNFEYKTDTDLFEFIKVTKSQLSGRAWKILSGG